MGVFCTYARSSQRFNSPRPLRTLWRWLLAKPVALLPSQRRFGDAEVTTCGNPNDGWGCERTGVQHKIEINPHAAAARAELVNSAACDEQPVGGGHSLGTSGTRAQRRRAGRDVRAICARSSHAGWEPRSASVDPIGLLEESNAGRIAGLIPLRYQRMAVSPLAFLRGSAIIQAHDLQSRASTGIGVQLGGDCHLMNFGGFATPERNVVFDVTDFDETFPGPFE